ncbi:MAG: hypothetical protein IH949_06710, partial [Bacteroidetes bacterium]|nr:hypothetical protein [Bacteroidota bacterium]
MKKLYFFTTLLILAILPQIEAFGQTITVTSPNGGESWQPGSFHFITFTDDITEFIKIDLYKGGVFDSVINDSTRSDGSTNWDIPHGTTPGADYKIKITSVIDSTLFDFSDADFTILEAPIVITSPNGGEDWQVNTRQFITWVDNIPEIPENKIKFELWKGGVLDTVLFDAEDPDNSKIWDIAPGTTLGNDYRIKLIYNNDPTVTSMSEADFTISAFVPEVTVTSPNGGESWQAGSTHFITSTDNIAEKIKIDLYKGGVFDTQITASTRSDGSKTWNISPGTTPGSDYKIKITSVDSATVFDFSDADFTIYPPITVTTPNGGESWGTGSSQTITWIDSLAENVKIELFKSNIFNSEITPSTESNGSFLWIIPGAITPAADYTIRITSINNTNLFDVSDANFSIFNPVISVTSPNGGENYRTGSSQTVTWTDNISEDVKIELFKDGVLSSTIIASTPSDGTFNWTVPVVADGSDYTVVITSTTTGTVSDVSDANFSIFNPVISVTSPNGGENYRTGSSQTITWTDNISEDVKIELFKGGVFNSTIIASTPSDGSHPWTVPEVADGSDYTLVITSTTEGTVTDVSDAEFSIFNPVITVTSPNGGENYRTGSSQTITWTDNISEDVKIELFKGGVFNSTIITSTPSDGSHPWTVPVVADGSDYTLVITSTTTGTVTDVSNANFSIFNPVITVTSPNGGENYEIATGQTTTWTDNISENVKIELFKGGVLNSTIIASTPSDGSHQWTVPVVADGSDYTVVITSTTTGTVTDLSDVSFSIFTPTITVTSPNDDEIWDIGTSHDITWTDNTVENVKIELFKGGVFNSTIVASTASDGTFNWTVPAVTQDSDYTVVITSVINGTVTDVSNANFTIQISGLSVSSPNGGEVWEIGSAHDITWTDNIAENVKIELFKGGVLNSIIVSSTASDGIFNWTIPAVTQASDYTVVITSVTNGTVTDVSDANFTIQTSSISVTVPNGSEVWEIGSAHDITWTDNIAENVKIELFKGGVINSAIVASTASDGIFNWTVPAVTQASDYTVVITSVTNGIVTDVSDANFTIQTSSISVTSPNGGEIWDIGSSNNITWTDNIAENVKIDLFKGGVFNSTIVASTPSDGNFSWIVPGITQASDYTVVITSVANGTVTDVSNANFTIQISGLTVSSPNGGEVWELGSAHNITWTDNIAENVKIELFKASVLNTIIIASTPSNGTFNWTVPAVTQASDYTVVITSVSNGSITDVSNANFTLQTSAITVTSPNGAEIWTAGTTQNITWTDNISENVTIDLYKGGTFHSEISTSTSSDGSKTWAIPFTQEDGNDYTVKITSVNDPGIFGFSNANFTIVGNQITVTAPNGGENWLDTEDQIISWTDNLTGNVEIQLFKNDVFHSSITTSTPSDESFTWNIPGTTPSASDYKIKIISADDAGVFDLSDANFTIINNDLIVVTPNGSENWLTSTSQNITWTDDISGDVKIDLYKAGVFDAEITAATPSDGSFTWNIPGSVAAGSDYKIKITSVEQPVLFDMSNASFTIFTGIITVSSPNGGESWQAGSSQVITWADNITEDVTIDLYKAGVFHSVISTATGSDGSKNWDIPFDFDGGSDYKVKITSVDNPSTIFDFSNANFTIAANQITVTSPNDGSENYLIGTSQIITWTDNLFGNVEIQLFKGGVFKSSLSTSTASDESFTWNISNSLVQGSDYKIRISSTQDGNIFDFSDADFTLSNEIIVAIPNGGQSWRQGTQHTISWTDNLSENVKIELFKGGVFDSEITASTPSSSSFSWDIPVSTAAGLDYKVKITSVNNASVFDFSDANFEIFAPAITVTSPNGAEIWTAGTTQNITWTDNISENVTIDLYKGGTFHSEISTSTSSDGSKTWAIPFTQEDGNDYTVKITSVNDPGIFGFSNAN